MSGIELARKVLESKTAHLFRPRAGLDPPVSLRGRGWLYDAKPYHARGNKRGWIMLDLYSASLVVQVHDALSEANRAKYGGFPLTRMVTVACTLRERLGGRDDAS